MRDRDQILLENLYDDVSNAKMEYGSPNKEDLAKSYQTYPKYEYSLKYIEDEDFDGNDASLYILTLKDPSTKENVGSAEFKIDQENNRIWITNIRVWEGHLNKKYGQIMYRIIADFAQKNNISKIYSDTVTPSAIRTRKKLFNLKMKKFGEHGLNAESDVDKNINYLS